MWKLLIKSLTAISCLLAVSSAQAWDQGIYLTQWILEKPDKLNYLIREAKASGINTFVIDHEYLSPHYAPAIAKVKAAGIKNVTRIIVFTDGATKIKFAHKPTGKKNGNWRMMQLKLVPMLCSWIIFVTAPKNLLIHNMQKIFIK